MYLEPRKNSMCYEFICDVSVTDVKCYTDSTVQDGFFSPQLFIGDCMSSPSVWQCMLSYILISVFRVWFSWLVSFWVDNILQTTTIHIQHSNWYTSCSHLALPPTASLFSLTATSLLFSLTATSLLFSLTATSLLFSLTTTALLFSLTTTALLLSLTPSPSCQPAPSPPLWIRKYKSCYISSQLLSLKTECCCWSGQQHCTCTYDSMCKRGETVAHATFSPYSGWMWSCCFFKQQKVHFRDILFHLVLFSSLSFVLKLFCFSAGIFTLIQHDRWFYHPPKTHFLYSSTSFLSWASLFFSLEERSASSLFSVSKLTLISDEVDWLTRSSYSDSLIRSSASFTFEQTTPKINTGHLDDKACVPHNPTLWHQKKWSEWTLSQHCGHNSALTTHVLQQAQTQTHVQCRSVPWEVSPPGGGGCVERAWEIIQQRSSSSMAVISSSSTGRNIHSLMLSIQDFLHWAMHHPPSSRCSDRRSHELVYFKTESYHFVQKSPSSGISEQSAFKQKLKNDYIFLDVHYRRADTWRKCNWDPS